MAYFDFGAHKTRRRRAAKPVFSKTVEAPDGTIRLEGSPVLPSDERRMSQAEAAELVRQKAITHE